MTFKDGTWSERYATMGDPAESVFERVYEGRYHRFGINRPPFTVRHVPEFVLYAPDYLTATHFVEVKGVGRDHTLKIKDKQLAALYHWDEQVFPVDIFIWDSYKCRYTVTGVQHLYDLCHDYGRPDKFPEGTHAWFLDLDNVVLTWSRFDM